MSRDTNLQLADRKCTKQSCSAHHLASSLPAMSMLHSDNFNQHENCTGRGVGIIDQSAVAAEPMWLQSCMAGLYQTFALSLFLAY